jgi:hypothetical protein
MPRYFFQLEHPSGVFKDDAGEEFDTVEEARGYAVRLAREVGRNLPERMREGGHVLVVDTAGAVVFRIPLFIELF